MTRKIVTGYWPKPVPASRFDWCAVFDNYEPGCPQGHGATEQEAIDDLLMDAEFREDADLTTEQLQLHPCGWVLSKVRCDKCLYLREGKVASGYGVCRRFPQKVTKRSNDWCGEFDPRFDADTEDAA